MGQQVSLGLCHLSIKAWLAQLGRHCSQMPWALCPPSCAAQTVPGLNKGCSFAVSLTHSTA